MVSVGFISVQPGNEGGSGGPRDDENPRKPPLCQRLYRQSLSELVVAVITIYREKGPEGVGEGGGRVEDEGLAYYTRREEHRRRKQTGEVGISGCKTGNALLLSYIDFSTGFSTYRISFPQKLTAHNVFIK
ncbi:hypothetical protein C1H46_024909 [Malus baccata]|uniref:Uncharacterized protein n=1 Tax=Malus baccata TaxID=106549 RepID=A0A540LSL6_MALBA|nr:hypothetical protein C1H46_024909 [Malus baccata]